jgi:multidrug efflux system membrane fusion protein
VLLLPLTALHRQGDEPAVWLYEPKSGQVHLKPVEVGRYREDGVTVLAGLAPGQWVVTAGVHKLAEGQTVRPVDASNRPLKM